jgi:hypothetical protein
LVQLLLKRASASRPYGEWSDDDYDMLADGVAVGRTGGGLRNDKRGSIEVGAGVESVKQPSRRCTCALTRAYIALKPIRCIWLVPCAVLSSDSLIALNMAAQICSTW